MREFTFRLKADASYLEKEFEKGAEKLAQLAAEAGKAEKKLEIFQEATIYLSQMDKMLLKVKKNYPDLFKQIFDGVDKQVKNALEPFKKMPEVINQALDKVGANMQDVLSGKNKAATLSEVKQWAKDIQVAANALDIKVDFSFLDEAKSSKKKVEGLVSVLKQLREAYHTTSDAAERANIAPIVPEVKQKKKRAPKKGATGDGDGTGAGGSGSGGSGSGSGYVENLTNSYTKLRDEIKKVKDGADFDKIINDFKLTEAEVEKLEDILYNTEDSLNDTIVKMKEFLGTRFPEMSLKDITSEMERMAHLQDKISDDATSKDERTKLRDELDDTREIYAGLTNDESEDVFDELLDGSLKTNEAAEKLAKLLGIDISKSANNVDSATSGIAGNIEDSVEKVKLLENAINEVIRNASKHKLEFNVVLNGEDVSVRKGLNATATDIVQNVGNMMSSLDKYFIDAHTHTTTSSMTNDSDIEYFAKLKKYGVTNHNAIIGKDGATAFDFSKVKDSDLELVIQKVKELGQSGNVTADQLAEIFTTIDSSYSDVVKRFDESQIGEFAKYIDTVTRNAKESIDPLTQFKNIINFLSDGKIDWSKYTKELADFTPENAKAIFDKIVQTQTDGKADTYDFSKMSMADIASDLASATAATEKQGAATEDLKTKAEAAKKSFQMLTAEVSDNWITMGDVDIGRNMAGLEDARNQLKLLAEQGAITADEMDRFEAEYNEAMKNLNMRKDNNAYDRESDKEALRYGTYDDGYHDGYSNARNDFIDELDEIRREKNELQQALSEAQQRVSGGQIGDAFGEEAGSVKANIQLEIDQLERLEKKIFEVKHAVEQKIKAFVNERRAVDSNVGAEINKLESLKTELQEIANLVNSINQINLGSVNVGNVQQSANITGIEKLISEISSLVVTLKAESSRGKSTNKKQKDKTIGELEEERKRIAEAKAEKEEKDLDSRRKPLSNETFKYLDKISKNDFVPDDAIDKVKLMQDLLSNITSTSDLDEWRRMWIDLTTEIDKAADKQREMVLGTQKNQFNGLKNGLQDAYSSIGISLKDATDEQLEFKASYDDLMERLKAYASSRSVVSDAEINAIEAEVSALKQKAVILAQNAKQAAAEKKIYGTKEVDGASKKLREIKSKTSGFEESDVIKNALTEVESAYDKLSDAKTRFAQSGRELNDAEKQEFQNLVNNFGQAYGELNKILSESKKLTEKGLWTAKVDKSVVSDVDKLKEAMKDAVKSSVSGRVKFGEFNKELDQLSYSTRNANGTWSHFVAQLDASRTKIVGLNTNLKQTNGFLRDIAVGSLSKMKSALANITGYDVIYRVLNEFKRGVQYVRDIDKALTELRKVTNETEETYTNFLQTMSQTASVVGSTVADLTNSAADWARLGYSIEQAGELAKNTAVLMNVSEFENVSDATDSMISALQAFNYSAEDSLHLVDIFNSIGNNFAISTSDLASSLTKSASALVTAGVGIEEASALLTGANTIMQDPDSVSQGLKIIALRVRGVKTELEAMGEETGDVLNTAKLQEKIKGLTGVDIVGDDGGFRNIYDILMDIAKVWKDLDSMSQAAVIEAMAGKNRANVFTSMMVQAETIKEAYEVAMNSEGSAMAENEKYLNSIEGRIDQFTNSVQTMWMNALQSEHIKWFVDAGTKLIKIFDQLNQHNPAGIFGTLTAVGISLYAAWKSAPKLFNLVWTAIKKNITGTAAETAATKTDTAAKKESAVQSTILATNLQAEAAARTAQTTATNAETAAIKANTAAQVENNKAHTGEIIDIIPDNVSDAIDDLADSGKVAKEITEEVAEEAAEAVLETAAVGTAAAGATKAAGTGLAGIGTKIVTFFSSSLGIFTLVVAGIGLVIGAIDFFTVSFKEAKNKLKETSDELNGVQSNLESLEKELDNISGRIDELNNKEKLSFTEKEELKNLRAQKSELVSIIALEEQREAILRNRQVRDALDTFKRDESFKTTSYTSATNEDGVEVRGVTMEVLPEVDRQLASIKKNKELLSKAQDELSDSQAKLQTAQESGKKNTSKEEKAVRKAAANVEIYKNSIEDTESSLMDLMKEREEIYGDVDFFYGDTLTEDQKAWNAVLTQIRADTHKVAIEFDTTGNAISTAFKEISGREFFQDELKSIQENVNITATELKEMMDADTGEDPYGMRAFIQTLIDAGVIADTTYAELQKVIDASIMISDGSSKEAIANKKLARSQKRLEYYDLAKQLHEYANNIEDLDDGEREHLRTIRSKMTALEAEIDAYDILSDEISSAKQAFEEFENAKTTDSNNDYMDDTADMLKTIVDGYQSAKMGTEAFKTAFTSIIPESVYEDIDTLQGRYEAGAKYIHDVIGKYFKFEYDDKGLLTSVEATSKGLETFFTDMSQKKGPNGEPLMSFTNGVWEVNETDWNKFVKYSGLTEEALYAIGMAADTVDADWIMGDDTTFLGSFDETLEAKIYNTTKALADLDEQLIENLANVESEEERDELLKQYAESYRQYSEEIKTYTDEAISNINAYNDATGAVDEATAELASAKEALASATTEEEIQIATGQVDEASAKLSTALAIKNDLSIPTELELTFAQDSVSAQIAAIQAQWSNTEITLPVMVDGKLAENELIKLNEEGKYVVNTELEGLTDEELSTLQGYADLVNTQGVINIYMENYQQEEDKLKTLNELVDGLETTLSNLSVEVEATAAINKLNEIKTLSDSIKDKTVTITTVEEKVDAGTRKPSMWEKIFGFARGTAYADGSWAAGVNTNKALVGELGPELRVRNGQYEVIGANGAEFTDVRPNDIIFNHKQTEEIFKNGHINTRGKAYSGGTMYTGGAIAAAYGGTVPNWFPKDTTLQNLGKIIEDASDSAEDSFEEMIDWFDILTEEIDHQVSVLEAQLDLAVGSDQKSAIYNGLIDLEMGKIRAMNEGIGLYTAEANRFLDQIPEKYVQMAKDGSVAITEFIGEANEATVEAIQNYRDQIGKLHDLELQVLESSARVSELRLEKFQAISEEYENQIGLVENLNSLVQGHVDLIKERGERVSKEFYEKMIDASEDQLKILKKQRKALQSELNSALRSGEVEKYSEEWYEMVSAINSVDLAIIDCETSIESFNNAIQDLHWENFEKLVTAIENVAGEAEHIRSLFDDDDIVDDNGDWTKEGITSLGMLMQEMENAEYRVKLYSDEIEYLNKEYKNGNYSQDEYNEKLHELKENQWDAIDAYESAKDSIIDLNKVRVDAVKDGLQKEIDAYEELINKRKEDLQAQKDEKDWNDTLEDHSDAIEAIQRQIDALEGDTSAAATAKRKQLESERVTAQEELDKILYDKEIEMQQEALDSSLEIYREGKEEAMNTMDEMLLHEDQVLKDSYELVKNNTELINATILEISDRYGIEITDAVVKPWESGMDALGEYSEKFNDTTSSYISNLDNIKSGLAALEEQANETAEALLEMLTLAGMEIGDIGLEGGSGSGSSGDSGGGGYSYDSSYGGNSLSGYYDKNGNALTKGETEDYLGTVGGVVYDKNGNAVDVNGAKRPTSSSSKSSSGSSKSFSAGQPVKVSSSATNFSSNSGNAKMASFVKGGSYTVMQTKGDQVLIGKGGVATGWVDKDDLNKYASGTTKVKKDELAWVDENGLEEIVMHAEGGRLAYLTKGSAVLPNDVSENLMKIGSVDPSIWLSKNKPNVAPTSIVTNNNVIDMSIGNLINIEHADRDSIPEIKDAVKKQLDSYMKNLNAGIKRYAR